jgi:hypothetical protein
MASNFLRDDMLPSWCPSLSSTFTRTPLSWDNAGHPRTFYGGHNDDVDIKDTFQPHYKYDWAVQSSADPNKICIFGSNVDSITQIDDGHKWNQTWPSNVMDGPRENASSLILWLRKTLALAQKVYTNRFAVPHEYVRTILSQYKDYGESYVEARTSVYEEFLASLEGEWLQENDTKNPSLTTGDLDTCLVFKALCDLWIGRVFIMTKNGRIGAAPSQVRIGDTVAVLFGGNTMYSIRKSENSHNWGYIGEMYVEGLMKGEVFELLDKGEVQGEMFTFD